MFFPYPVIDQLDDAQVATWEKHFAGAGHERPRAIEEGIRRRTQDPANALQSGWTDTGYGRPGVVHYRYRYDLDYTFPVPRLVLADLYLYTSVLGPRAEIGEYRDNVRSWLSEGGWRPIDDTMFSKGDLHVTVTPYDDSHPQDERASRATPAGERTTSPPVCEPCAVEAARACPHLRKGVCGGPGGVDAVLGSRRNRLRPEHPPTDPPCPGQCRYPGRPRPGAARKPPHPVDARGP